MEAGWRMSRKRIATGAGLTLGAAFALAAPAQAAADIVVDTTADTAPDTLPNNGCEATGGDECTLREATLKANADSGEDTIVFASGLTGSIDLDPTLGQLSLTEGVQISHAGDPSALSINGQHNGIINGVRLFDINATAADQTVSIQGLTLKQGYGTYGGAVYVHNPNPATLDLTNDIVTDNHTIGGGGAVYSYTQVNVQSSTVSYNTNNSGGFVAGAISAKFGLSIYDSTFTHNYSNTTGGAIVASGDVEIARSTFDQNSSDSNGGAITLTGDTPGSADITDSTFTTNFANSGGAITQAMDSPDLTISRSTFSGDRAAEGGGAISDYYSSLAVENSTISGNEASHNGFNSGGGGVYAYIDTGDDVSITGSTFANNSGYLNGGIMRVAKAGAPDTQIDSTIVAGNTATSPTPAGTDIAGVFHGSFNLVQDLGAATLTGASNILGQDPQLDPLASNGGLTQTRKPALTSPVIDKGSAFGLTTDQRGAGFARTFDMGSVPNAGDGTDIGAFELQASDLPSSPPATTPPTQSHKKKCRKKKAKKHSASAAKKKCKKKKKR
jgi:predicted outer membrane repeat protein